LLTSLRRRFAELQPRGRLVLLLTLTGLGATHCAPTTWNDESRMATIQALVESHTFVIDHTEFVSTGDKVFIDGHFYSDKPPLPAMLGAVVYFPLYHLGLRLHGGNSLAYYFITLLTVSLFWLLGTLAFFQSLKFTGLDAERRLLAGVALSLGTIYFSWSTTFNNHEIAASFLAIGFCFILKARHENFGNRNLAFAGTFLSLAAAADMPTGIFFALFLVYVLRDPLMRRRVLFYVLPLVVTVLPTLAINYSIHSSIMPVQIYRSYFEYSGSPWLGSDQLSGMATHDLAFSANYAFLTLFGPKGFVIYNPLLLVSLWGLVHAIRQRDRFLWEAMFIAGGSGIIFLYYWSTTNNFAGWSYSIRWFVPLLPLLMFFLYPCLAGFGKVSYVRTFNTLLCISVIIALVGALNPWSPLVYSRISFVANIEQFVAHLRHPVSVPSRQ
jgi:hypothetical protein